MEWLIWVMVLIVVLMALSGGTGEKATKAPTSGKAPYAQIHENGSCLPLTATDVENLFAEIRERLREHRRTASAMKKLASKFEESGKRHRELS